MWLTISRLCSCFQFLLSAHHRAAQVSLVEQLKDSFRDNDGIEFRNLSHESRRMIGKLAEHYDTMQYVKTVLDAVNSRLSRVGMSLNLMGCVILQWSGWSLA